MSQKFSIPQDFLVENVFTEIGCAISLDIATEKYI